MSGYARGYRIPRAAVCVLTPVLLLALSGCQQAVLGHWRLVNAVPNKQTFSLDHVDFRSDGTFSATTTTDGRTLAETGTFDFDGAKLRLRPSNGGQRTYIATARFDRLEVSPPGQNKRHAVLQRTR